MKAVSAKILLVVLDTLKILMQQDKSTNRHLQWYLNIVESGWQFLQPESLATLSSRSALLQTMHGKMSFNFVLMICDGVMTLSRESSGLLFWVSDICYFGFNLSSHQQLLQFSKWKMSCRWVIFSVIILYLEQSKMTHDCGCDSILSFYEAAFQLGTFWVFLECCEWLWDSIPLPRFTTFLVHRLRH